ncbi:hypothetical protein ACHAXN_012178 [Cyclotella atomus]
MMDPTILSVMARGLITQQVHSSNVAVVGRFFRKKLTNCVTSSASFGHTAPNDANDEVLTILRTPAMTLAPRNDTTTSGSGRANSLNSTFINAAAASTSPMSIKVVDFKSTNVYPALSIISITLPIESYSAGDSTHTVLSSALSKSLRVASSA